MDVIFFVAAILGLVGLVLRGGAEFRGLSLLGPLVMIGGGVWLVATKAAGADSLMEYGLRGVGLYCIGRGISDLSRPWREQSKA